MTDIVCRPKPFATTQLERARQSHAMVPRPFSITDLQWETGAGDIFTWTLEPNDGVPLTFAPGQFNMIYVHGQGEVPISICADAANGPLIHTTRAVGGVTRAMARLGIGAEVGIRGPFGSHWPLADAEGRDVILVAGGLGLPPLRPVIYHILNQRQRFQRVWLLYGARTPLDLVYRGELSAWHQQDRIHVLLTVDKAEGQWRDNIGVVPQLLNQVTIDPANTVAMMCGPEVMMHFCRLALNKIGVADESIYLSMERNMKCAIGQCGHCQWGPHFICKDGPVYRFDEVGQWFGVHQL